MIYSFVFFLLAFQNEVELEESNRHWVMQSLGDKYKNWKANLKKKFIEKNTYVERLENRPPNVTVEDWKWLVDYWSKPEVQVLYDKFV